MKKILDGIKRVFNNIKDTLSNVVSMILNKKDENGLEYEYEPVIGEQSFKDSKITYTSLLALVVYALFMNIVFLRVIPIIIFVGILLSFGLKKKQKALAL